MLLSVPTQLVSFRSLFPFPCSSLYRSARSGLGHPSNKKPATGGGRSGENDAILCRWSGGSVLHPIPSNRVESYSSNVDGNARTATIGTAVLADDKTRAHQKRNAVAPVGATLFTYTNISLINQTKRPTLGTNRKEARRTPRPNANYTAIVVAEVLQRHTSRLFARNCPHADRWLLRTPSPALIKQNICSVDTTSPLVHTRSGHVTTTVRRSDAGRCGPTRETSIACLTTKSPQHSEKRGERAGSLTPATFSASVIRRQRTRRTGTNYAIVTQQQETSEKRTAEANSYEQF